MKLQFKHQKFQADAAKAVVDVFAGQPYLTPTYVSIFFIKSLFNCVYSVFFSRISINNLCIMEQPA